MRRLPDDYSTRAEHAVRAALTIDGHLTAREARFLYLLGAIPTAQGHVLEIGSFRGRSTVLLAQAAQQAGDGPIIACDPMGCPAPTDPQTDHPPDAASLMRTLQRHGVSEHVEFHPMRSQQLAEEWNRPLRLLWIDGDHTITGARADVETFARHLAPGAILAMHDVLHRFEGCVLAFCDGVLARENFGPCGVCGSIAWARYLGANHAWPDDQKAKSTLQRRLRPLIPWMKRPGPGRWGYQFLRSRIPHGDVDPATWIATIHRPPLDP